MAVEDNLEVLQIKKLMKAAFGRWDDRATFRLSVSPSSLRDAISVHLYYKKHDIISKIPKWKFWEPRTDILFKEEVTCLGFVDESYTLVHLLQMELRHYINYDQSKLNDTPHGKAILEYLNISKRDDKINRYKDIISKL